MWLTLLGVLLSGVAGVLDSRPLSVRRFVSDMLFGGGVLAFHYAWSSAH